MTTATKESPTPAKKEEKKPQLAKILFQGAVQLDKIDVVSNVRKKFDEHAIKELAGNIASIGVTTPILLRPAKKEGRYELVAGERRLRAAKSINLKEIPAIVKELDDNAALEHQAAENIHRKDLTPIEEARTFKALLDAKRYTVSDISDLIGKNKVYVYRSISILELPKEIVEAIEAGELTPAHGRQILRVPPADRKGLFSVARQCTAKELQERLDQDEGENLSKARFDLKKPYAGEIACTACPYNSGNQDQLFDGAEKGTCLNTKCFEKKTTLVRQEQLDLLRKKYPTAKFVQAMSGWIYVNNSGDKGFVVRGEFDKPPKGEFALILSINDDKVYLATPETKEKAGSRSSGSSSAAPKTDPKDEFVDKKINDAIAKAIVNLSGKLTRKHLIMLAAKAVEMADDSDRVVEILGFDADVTDRTKLTDAQLSQILVIATLMDFDGEIGRIDAKTLGVDVAAVEKAAKVTAEVDWIKERAGKGFDWPKNIKAIDVVLLRAIGKDGWATYKTKGISDEQLTDAIASKFGIMHSQSGPGDPGYLTKGYGLQLWIGGNITRTPSLSGPAVRARVRILLELPYEKNGAEKK